ncbi:MAG: DUF1593 domain-containing protein [Sphingobacteriaceae bacterium]|nr:DUF1593 domain-containing protein [Sphingobacteriaceae bacterium]
MKKFLVLNLLVLFSIGDIVASNQNSKPRVIVMTDGEIDDHSSMIRFLMYSCEVEVCAIIETNSIFQREGHSKEDWYEKQLEAYSKIYPNLTKHNPYYPSPKLLKEISFIGDEDHDHLRDLIRKRWELIPGAKITFTPENWKDTPGSDKIVEVLLEKNPAPVHIQAWGGGNTAARAFYKLKKYYPNDYRRALSKVVMYNIWYQDGAGNYIEQNHPEVTMLYCGSFAGTWNYRSQPNTKDFISQNIKSNHGPLGALYPQDYISEGDSPAFLYSIANGLRNYEHPTYGGWGGRFTKFNQFERVYTDAQDDGDLKKSLRRWIDDANDDFEARMDWCLKSYEEANHHPNIQIKEKSIKVKSGKKITLDAGKTIDPDGDALKFNWWQYKDAGSYSGIVTLKDADSDKVSFTAPKVTKEETIHIIFEVSDNGSPSLKGYQRVIALIVP